MGRVSPALSAFMLGMPALVIFGLGPLMGLDMTSRTRLYILVLAIVVGVNAWSWTEYRMVWWSFAKRYDTDGSAVDLVETALREGGVGYSKEPTFRTLFAKDYHVIHISGTDLRIHIDRVAWVYIGPVGKGREEAIERLKDLVDRTMETTTPSLGTDTVSPESD